MLTKELKDKLMKLLECCSDSDIEDFIDENNLTSEEAGEVWRLVAEDNAPDCCKDCKFVMYFKDSYPCRKCIRSVHPKDYYEKRN
jgi:hypothetical protein